MPDVVMPRLSDSMEEGTIVRWLKADGDTVRRGEEIVEIETDKATMAYEADADGELRTIAAEGDTLPIGELIATIGEPGDGARAAQAPPGPPVAVQGDVAAPAESALPVEPQAARAAAGRVQGDGARVKASPVARRLARERGVDLHALAGTGPGGRIVRADVEGAPAAAPAGAPPPAPVTVSDAGSAKGAVSAQELTRTQQLIARRMAEAKATVPEFTLQSEIDMEEAVLLRVRLKALAGEGGIVPSYNDMIVRACGLALREHPRANGAYRDGRFELHERVNVGIAVAAADALVVPTIFDADRKSLRDIAADSRALSERVRAGVVTPPELSGGTFTVSNLGMFGVTNFTAVINPPQAAILAVGALARRPVVHGDEIVARHTMHVTLACDHRILYGADAARFLGRVRELLQEPLALLT